MDNSRPRQSDHLGVNKIGKNIRKSPLHQPNFANANTARPQPQPQVYNISKNDFRSIVQQLTGSPSRESLPQPPQNPPKPQNTRLHKIRPAPLTQINRPPVPSPGMAPPPPAQFNNNFVRPPPQPYAQPLPQAMQPMMGHRDQVWSNTAESPVSVYMRYLQSSLADSGPSGNQMQPDHQSQSYMFAQSQPQPHMPVQSQQHMPGHPQPQPRGQPQPPPFGSVPYSAMPVQPMPPSLPSPRFNGPVPVMPALPSPRFNGPPQQMHGLPSPQFNGPGLLPSPTSQFLLPSPTAYPNLFSPRSPYPLLSPGVQYPPPLTPTFSFSPMGQPGVLGPGPGPQPPPSPGLMFPLSPSGFFPISSPRWRDH